MKTTFIIRRLVLLTVFFGCAVGMAAPIDNTFQQIKKKPQALHVFLQHMPKGGELHVHFDGSMDADTLIQLAIQQNACVDPKTFVLSAAHSCQGTPIRTFLRTPTHRQHLINAWSMRNILPDDPKSHDHFFDVFQKVNVIYRNFSTQILAKMIQGAAAQHVLYLEILRLHNADNKAFAATIANTASFAKKRRLLLANPAIQERIQNQVLLAEKNLTQAHHLLECDKDASQSACSVTVRFQYFILRAESVDTMFVDALIGFEAMQKSPLIVGVNIVQPEKAPLAAQYFQQQMAVLDFLHQQYPDVPLALHAGELRPEMTADKQLKNHIQESISRGHAKRIGHGTALFEESNYVKLVGRMAKQSIAVEINLTSNQDILGIKDAQHPFLFYIKHHVPVVLSTDDGGILATDLTQEYVRAVQRYDLDYQTIKQISRNGLTYSFLPGESLWLDAYRQIPVTACKTVLSETCHKWVEKSPKAQLQWKLEKDLVKFERTKSAHR